MTCAQGLLRLLWGGPEVGVLRDCVRGLASRMRLFKFLTAALLTPALLTHVVFGYKDVV